MTEQSKAKPTVDELYRAGLVAAQEGKYGEAFGILCDAGHQLFKEARTEYVEGLSLPNQVLLCDLVVASRLVYARHYVGERSKGPWHEEVGDKLTAVADIAGNVIDQLSAPPASAARNPELAKVRNAAQTSCGLTLSSLAQLMVVRRLFGIRDFGQDGPATVPIADVRAAFRRADNALARRPQDGAHRVRNGIFAAMAEAAIGSRRQAPQWLGGLACPGATFKIEPEEIVLVRDDSGEPLVRVPLVQRLARAAVRATFLMPPLPGPLLSA